MSKNRVATDKSLKKYNSVFKKSSQKFNNSKFQHKYKKDKSNLSTDPSNFFIKTNDPGTSNVPKTLKEHDVQQGTSNVPNTLKEHDVQQNSDSKRDKKPFDKKKYRLQKYSKKYQLEQWEEKRKKSVLRGYYKTLKDDELNPSNTIHEELTENINKEQTNDTDGEKILQTDKSDTRPGNSKEKRNKVFRKAHQEFQRIKEEKEKAKELLLEKKKEKQEAMQKYKKKKIETYKKLNKKTKKGQPIMKDRLEMLLEKIQNSVKQD